MCQQLNYECEDHPGSECPDVVILLCKDGTLALRAINAEYYCEYCPWCGTKWHAPIEEEHALGSGNPALKDAMKESLKSFYVPNVRVPREQENDLNHVLSED